MQNQPDQERETWGNLHESGRRYEQEGQTLGGASRLQEEWPEPRQALLARMAARSESVLLGKGEVIGLAMTAMLAGGHILLEDVPGVGKTLLARALARVLGGKFQRIQFTSDLLPADLTGSAVWDARKGEFIYREGPVMANVVLADEINRTSPRTQSALLEAMEERCVTVDGTTRKLASPWLLIATQNPLDSEGTFPLPEAQMDRFMMRLSIGYPEAREEIRMLEMMGAGEQQAPEQLRPVVSPRQWEVMAEESRSVHCSPELLAYMVRIVQATRSAPELELGASPRASRDWLRAAQATAYIAGRDYVRPADLKVVATSVLAHRLAARGAYGQPDRELAMRALARLLAETPLSVTGKAAAR
ncbi:MoxR-like ATPase [Paenibacillaceae bacterium GAS479]|nr:MoxR-like ATPase [Paenibacillaceae bacterium GAS479]